MGIPPIQQPGIFGGQPTCPSGYYYDPASQQCQPIPGSPTVQTIKVTAWGTADPNIDPVQAAKNAAVGWGQSGFIGQFTAALWVAFWKSAEISISLAFDIYDRVIAFVADEVSNAVTRNNPGLWIAIGSLLSDLLGVTLDGQQLFNQLATRGTLPAMQAVGGSLIDLLIGEFTGTATGSGGQVAFSSQIDPATGLPPATLSPSSGLNGAKALMGFVLTSAVRQANIDGLVEIIPFGFGNVFEKYSEGVRTNLGIGRMMRFALKPIFKVLIADQVARGMNMEYTPTIFSAEEAIKAFNNGDYTAQDLQTEMSYHGYNNKRAFALARQKQKNPDIEDVRLLYATGLLTDSDRRAWLHNEGYTDAGILVMDQAADMRPARDAVLSVVSTLAHKYLNGAITSEQFQTFVTSMQTRVGGQQMLTPGEVAGYLNLPAITGKAPKHVNINLATLTTMYEDGVIDLTDYQNALADRGYTSDQQSELVLLLLIKAKAAAEKAAAAAAKLAAAGGGTTTPPTTPAPLTPP